MFSDELGAGMSGALDPTAASVGGSSISDRVSSVESRVSSLESRMGAVENDPADIETRINAVEVTLAHHGLSGPAEPTDPSLTAQPEEEPTSGAVETE